MAAIYYCVGCVGCTKDYQIAHFKNYKCTATLTHIAFFFPNSNPPLREEYYICTKKVHEMDRALAQPQLNTKTKEITHTTSKSTLKHKFAAIPQVIKNEVCIFSIIVIF